MSMSIFALQMVEVEVSNRRRTRAVESSPGDTCTVTAEANSTSRPRRSKRTGYHNNIQTTCLPSDDLPPVYSQAIKTRCTSSTRACDKSEPLPGYSCTVATEGRMLVNFESVNPLHIPAESDWKEVYVVLRGTMLNLHRLKDARAGKLIRSYTLQHAEVGLATDVQHTVLVPQSTIARLIPQAARRKAWQRDDDLFKPEAQSILRLRVETDQLLLADPSEESIFSMILAICAGIDIAPAIDERGLPKQCTLPRRRRRPRMDHSIDVNDPALLRQQARILDQRFPGLAASPSDHPAAETRPTFLRTTSDSPSEMPLTPFREDDEPDLSLLRDDTLSTTLTRTTSHDILAGSIHTGTSLPPSPMSDLASFIPSPTSGATTTTTTKWHPSTPSRSPAALHRYIRRCLPVLPAEAPRASDVVVVRGGGARLRIDWTHDALEPWVLAPPAYDAHGFARPAAAVATDPRGDADADADDAIAPAAGESEDGMTGGCGGGGPLTKMASATSVLAAKSMGARRKGARTAAAAQVLLPQDMHGAVFCF